MPLPAAAGHRLGMRDETTEALEGFASTAQVAGAERVARALTVGFALCDEAGFPLSERQRISMFTAALLGFDGFHAETEGLLNVEQFLAGLSHRDVPGL
jgi:hypothetical protein